MSELIEQRLGIGKSLKQVSILISDFILTDSPLEINMSECCLLNLFLDFFDIGSVFIIVVVFKSCLISIQAILCELRLILKYCSCVVLQLRHKLGGAPTHQSNCELIDIG